MISYTRSLLLTIFFLISSSWWTILDAVSPTWEQLENAMVAVKTVVHGLVDFIQNYSRKGHETPQVSKVISLPDCSYFLMEHAEHLNSLFG